MNDLRPYPRMKDSGVEWLGEVPAHWRVSQLGRIGRFFKGNGGTKADETDEGTPCVRYGDLYTNHRFHITETQSRVDPLVARTAYTFIQYGDVLFAGSGETIEEIGKSAANLMRCPACCGGDVIVLRPNGAMNPAFLGYATDCLPAAQQKAQMGRGFTVMHIYGADLKRLNIAVPPAAEQAAIARYLDHATSRIDRQIRAKEKLVPTLDEYRQALVNQAVTGRIDVRTGRPYPAYRESRFGRVASVPTHWTVRRLKSLVTRIDQGVSPQAENYLAGGSSWGVLKAGCANGGTFREDQHKRLPIGFAFDPGLAVADGDVLVSRASGSPHLVGSTARVVGLSHNLILSDKTFRPIFGDDVDAEFMTLAMNSRYYREQVGDAISGAEGLANNLPLSALRGFRFALPPLSEQRSVVRFLGKALGLVREASSDAVRKTSRLREYQVRLVADVVTGKLDVREAAIGLDERTTTDGIGLGDAREADSWSDAAKRGFAMQAES